MAAGQNRVDIRVNVNSGDAADQLRRVSQSTEELGQSGASAGSRLQTLTNALMSMDSARSLGGWLRDYASEIAGVADQWNLMQARLGLVTQSTEEAVAAQQQVIEIANNSRASIDDVSGLYVRLSQALKSAGQSTTDTAGLTETITQALKLSGASAQETQSAITQLGQGLAAGALRGEEFNSVNENGSRLMQALAAGLGKTTGELRQMAADGKLTTQVVTDALKSQAGVIGGEFEKLPITISDSVQLVKNSFSQMLGDFDDTSKSSQAIAEAIKAVSDNLHGLASIAGDLGLAALAGAAVKAATAFGGYAKGLYEARVAQKEATAATEAAAMAERETASVVAQAARTEAVARSEAAQAAVVAAEQKLAAANAAKIEAAEMEAFARQQGITGAQRAAIERDLVLAVEQRIAAEQGLVLAQKEALMQSELMNAAALKAASAQRALTATQEAAQTGWQQSAGAIKGLLTPMGALNAVMVASLAMDFGSWLYDNSKTVRLAGVALAEVVTDVVSLFQALDEAISGQSDGAWDRHKQRLEAAEAGYAKLYAEVDKGVNLHDKSRGAVDKHSASLDQNTDSASRNAAAATTAAGALEAAAGSVSKLDEAYKALDVAAGEALTGFNTKQLEASGALKRLAQDTESVSAVLAAGFSSAVSTAKDNTHLLNEAVAAAAMAYQDGRISLSDYTTVLDSMPEKYRRTSAEAKNALALEQEGVAALKEEHNRLTAKLDEWRGKVESGSLSQAAFNGLMGSTVKQLAEVDEQIKKNGERVTYLGDTFKTLGVSTDTATRDLSENGAKIKTAIDQLNTAVGTASDLLSAGYSSALRKAAGETAVLDAAVKGATEAYKAGKLDLAGFSAVVADMPEKYAATSSAARTAYEIQKAGAEELSKKMDTLKKSIADYGAQLADGSISAKEHAEKVTALKLELDRLQGEFNQVAGAAKATANEVRDAFAALGAKTKTELQAAADEAIRNFTIMRDSGQANLGQLAAVWPKVKEAAVAALGETGAKTVLDRLMFSVTGLTTKLDEAGKQGEKTGESLSKGLEKASASAEKTTGDAEKLSAAFGMAGESADGAAMATDGLASSASNVAGAVEAVAISLEALAQNAGASKAQIQELSQNTESFWGIYNQLQSSQVLSATMSGVQGWLDAQNIKTRTAIDLTEKLNQSAAALNAEISTGADAAAMLRTISHAQGLEQQFKRSGVEVSGFSESVVAAQEKLKAFNEEMTKTATANLSGLRQELAQLKGDEEALLKIQLNEKKIALQKEFNEARAAGNREAMAALSQAIKVENEIAAIKTKNLKEQREAEQKAAAEKRAEERAAALEAKQEAEAKAAAERKAAVEAYQAQQEQARADRQARAAQQAEEQQARADKAKADQEARAATIQAEQAEALARRGLTAQAVAEAQAVANAAAAAAVSAQASITASISAVTGLTDKVSAAFSALGIKTRAELQAAADEAVANFKLIRDSGLASTEQLAIAFKKVETTVSESLGAAGARSVLDTLIDTTHGLKTALTAAGNAGADAGAAISNGLGQAEKSAASVKAAFANLGVKSKSELQGIAEQAIADFKTVSASGDIATDQLVKAFQATRDAVQAAMGEDGAAKVMDSLINKSAALGGALAGLSGTLKSLDAGAGAAMGAAQRDALLAANKKANEDKAKQDADALKEKRKAEIAAAEEAKRQRIADADAAYDAEMNRQQEALTKRIEDDKKKREEGKAAMERETAAREAQAAAERDAWNKQLAEEAAARDKKIADDAAARQKAAEEEQKATADAFSLLGAKSNTQLNAEAEAARAAFEAIQRSGNATAEQIGIAFTRMKEIVSKATGADGAGAAVSTLTSQINSTNSALSGLMAGAGALSPATAPATASTQSVPTGTISGLDDMARAVTGVTVQLNDLLRAAAGATVKLSELSGNNRSGSDIIGTITTLRNSTI